MEWLNLTVAAKLLGIDKSAINHDPTAEQYDNGKRGTHRKISSEYVTAKVKQLRDKQQNEDITKARTRKEIALANMAEDEAALKRGELVYCSIIESGLSNAFANFRNNLLSLPNQVSPLLVNHSDVSPVRAILNKEFEIILSQLHDDIDNIGL